MQAARLLLSAVLTIFGALSGAAAAPRMETAAGVVEGVAADGVFVFRSIPFAAAPIGNWRWRAPQPPPSWRGVRAARAFGPSCMQNISPSGWGPWTGEFSPQGAVSEDCLTLTVWRPAEAQGAALPIMLWIPGGGFTDGGEATAVYDGAALARRGIVVVSINYRLGAFGLLAHPDLTPEPDGAIGNYALRDALAALRWVHDNAAAFGGDRRRITIAGQSAGGALVYAMLAHPQARRLIAGAIIQSFIPGSVRLGDASAMRRASRAFADRMGVGNLDALRSASPEAILAASGDTELALFVDGATIRDPLLARLTELADVPILMGVTFDEISFMQPNLAQYRRRAAQYGEGFLALYPAATDEQAFEAVLRSDREASLVALERWGRARARTSTAATFMYAWRHSPPGPDTERYRSFHSSELPYVFNSLAAAPQRNFGERDRAIADVMTAYWSNFVKSGAPGGDDLPSWSEFGEGSSAFMELGDRFAPLPGVDAEVSAFFNAHYDGADEYAF
jgi:para-nitrobenzyl esterase